MYLNILKKDLKRKKAMNIILLIFIILATMFVASSVNNIISVTTVLDNYFDMANVPDYLVMTIDKMLEADVEEVLSEASSIENYGTEKVLFMVPDNITFEDENVTVTFGSNWLQSDKDLPMNYFLSDESILETVKEGEIYLTAGRAETIGLKKGDKVIIKIENVRKEFTFAGTVKDAALGSEMNSVCRYIINREDFEAFISDEIIREFYGCNLYYIHTGDLEKTISEISGVADGFALTGDRALLKFSYVFDMIVTGFLLVVSVVLILVAFVVLRFTITFTLSEEFREIGIMKAIGIGNLKIRTLYLIKYATISVTGSVIGLGLSIPFGKLLMSVSSKSIMLGEQNLFFINIICAIFVVVGILLFCYGCTGIVKKMTPIDAIRNGQTGERFHKKSMMCLGKSKLTATSFLALNDIVSSPKRYGIIMLTFFLCLSLMLMLSATVSTMKSGTLAGAFGHAEYDVSVSSDGTMDYLTEGGREKLIEKLNDMEDTFAENGMPASCSQEVGFSLPVICGENKINIPINQGTGTTMDRYEYTEGTVPQNCDEIAITRISANMLGVGIGDTVTIKTIDGDKEYIIAAFFQTMENQGNGIKLYTDEEINYIQAQGCSAVHVLFTDHPDDDEIARRMERIKELYPECNEVETCEKVVADTLGVTDTLDAVKTLVTILTIVLAALITVLMERSFIAKEQGEIALMKAIGTRNGKIYEYHALRFLFVGVIVVIIGDICALPLTHLCIDPIFRMMGMELAVDYVINPVEMYFIFPLVVLMTTTVSAFLTSLYTRKIKPADTANIE